MVKTDIRALICNYSHVISYKITLPCSKFNGCLTEQLCEYIAMWRQVKYILCVPFMPELSHLRDRSGCATMLNISLIELITISYLSLILNHIHGLKVMCDISQCTNIYICGRKNQWDTLHNTRKARGWYLLNFLRCEKLSFLIPIWQYYFINVWIEWPTFSNAFMWKLLHFHLNCFDICS